MGRFTLSEDGPDRGNSPRIRHFRQRSLRLGAFRLVSACEGFTPLRQQGPPVFVRLVLLLGLRLDGGEPFRLVPVPSQLFEAQALPRRLARGIQAYHLV